MPVALTAKPKFDIFEIADNSDTEYPSDETITFAEFCDREYEADQRLYNLMVNARSAGLMPHWPCPVEQQKLEAYLQDRINAFNSL